MAKEFMIFFVIKSFISGIGAMVSSNPSGWELVAESFG